MSDDNSSQMELLPLTVDENAVILKFETTEHYLDATLMANTLLAFNSSIVGFAYAEHLDGTKVSVQSVKSGCIEIGAIIATFQTAGATVSYIGTLWKHLKSLYELYRFLQGQPPQKTIAGKSQTVVENQIGQLATFNNCVVNQYTYSNSTFIGNGETLLQDKNISGVTILDEKRQPILAVPRDEFKNLIPYKKVPKDQSEQYDEQELLLTIATVNLDNPHKSWSFINEDGLQFVARIEDESFIGQIDSGAVAFRQGDKIRCRMEIIKKFDIALNTYIIKKRKIKEVLQYTPRILFVEPRLSGI